MRKIKFRARWNDTGKKIKDFNDQYIIADCNDSVFTVEQYTGLKDKNGKEIYEGDWVRVREDSCCGATYFEEYYIEPFDNRKMTYILNDGKDYGNQKTHYKPSITYILNAPMVEIIGNIHENPEILKEN